MFEEFINHFVDKLLDTSPKKKEEEDVKTVIRKLTEEEIAELNRMDLDRIKIKEDYFVLDAKANKLGAERDLFWLKLQETIPSEYKDEALYSGLSADLGKSNFLYSIKNPSAEG